MMKMFLLTLLLLVPPFTAHAENDDFWSDDDYSVKSIQTHDRFDDHYFGDSRHEDRIRNDSVRQNDDHIQNRLGNGRSGTRSMGDAVLDQLKPINGR